MESKGTIVFLLMDAVGHIMPSLSIIKELKKRGYRPIILIERPPKIAAKLESLGYDLEYVESSNSRCDEQLKPESLVSEKFDIFRQSPEEAFKACFSNEGILHKIFDAMVQSHDALEAKLKSLNPKLIILDALCGIPCVTYTAPKWVRIFPPFSSLLHSFFNDNIIFGLGLSPNEVTPEKKQMVSEIREGFDKRVDDYFILKTGKSNETNRLGLSPHLNIYLGIDELEYSNVTSIKPLPQNYLRVEHTIDPSESSEQFTLPETLKSGPGKLIYVSFGTLVSSDFRMMNRLLEILSKSPNRFIVSMGSMCEHVKLHPNMWGEGFINQRGVLPLVDLFITHGGHNSIIEAFYYGVKGLIVMPVFADQFDCAQTIQDLGFGVRMNPFSCSEQELLGAINSVLGNEEIGSRFSKISSRLRSIEYHKIAADKIEELMTE